MPENVARVVDPNPPCCDTLMVLDLRNGFQRAVLDELRHLNLEGTREVMV